MARATGNLSVPKEAGYVYSLSWLVGTVVAGVVYTVLGKVWPMEGGGDKFEGEAGQVMDGSSFDRQSNSDEGGKGTTVSEKTKEV